MRTVRVIGVAGGKDKGPNIIKRGAEYAPALATPAPAPGTPVQFQMGSEGTSMPRYPVGTPLLGSYKKLYL